MKKVIWLFSLLLLGRWIVGEGECLARSVVYTQADSLLVEQLLDEVSGLPKNESRILFFAKKFLDKPYVAATLEIGKQEQLVVNLQEFDCTTFVETILALCLACEHVQPDFHAFTNALCTLRYRQGQLEEYPSRLHYFSDWIEDNSSMGIVEEVAVEQLPFAAIQILQTDYMSRHPEKYRQLAENIYFCELIRQQEKRLIGRKVHYIPKNALNKKAGVLPIQDGDVLALTTRLSGLDVSHLGFAVWVEGKLHLLHASMRSQKVILDSQTLYQYTNSLKSQTGVRVIRLKKSRK